MGSLRVEVQRVDFTAGQDGERVFTLDCWRVRFFMTSPSGDFTGYFWNGVPLTPAGLTLPSLSLDVRLGGLVMGQDVRPVNLSQVVRITSVNGVDRLSIWLEREYYDENRPNLQG